MEIYRLFNSNITKIPLRRVICIFSKFYCVQSCKTLSLHHENQFRLIFQIYSLTNEYVYAKMSPSMKMLALGNRTCVDFQNPKDR